MVPKKTETTIQYKEDFMCDWIVRFMEIVISESLGTIQQNGGWHRGRRPPPAPQKESDAVLAVVNLQRRQSNPQEMTMKLTPPG